MSATDREMVDFKRWREKYAAAIDESLDDVLRKLSAEQPAAVKELLKTMRYALLGGGKRLRPLLALAASEAVGGRTREALPAALAVELIHAYSLVHDDLPALDNDDLRRGRPTCHKAFGEAAAILAGDALLTLAFEILADAGRKSLEAARRSAGAVLILARSAGALGMVGGQVMDLAFERSANDSNAQASPTADMVRDMETRKTGELISAALTCGAMLGGGDAGAIRRMKNIGLTIGLAFQIKDDLLNQTGDPALLGKAVGSDAARGKASFPAVAGPVEAAAELEKLRRKSLAVSKTFGLGGKNLNRLLQDLVDRRN